VRYLGSLSCTSLIFLFLTLPFTVTPPQPLLTTKLYFLISPTFRSVKVRLQASICHYNSPWSCFRSIVNHEGFSGLFRGLSSPLVGGALETGLNYGVYESVLPRLSHLPDSIAIPVSAATAGFFLSWIVSPAELVKCRMQLGAADIAHSYTGPIDCMRQVVRSEGLRGLFRGITGTLAREMPGNAVYFGTYKTLRKILPGKRQNTDQIVDIEQPDISSNGGILNTILDATSAITAGAISGMVMWATVLPIDVAKTRMQTAWPGSARDVGLITQLKNMYREGGRRVMYAGLTPTLIRAAPANVSKNIIYNFSQRR
jgi:solute carrier family 25 (mitochondrial carnitine/acylcarnitine transporter), member 20/29